MVEMIVYGVGFFLCTLAIQYMLYKVRKDHNQGKYAVWVGSRAAIILCVVGIVTHRLGYFGAIIGFICADTVGKERGWH